MKEKGSVRRPVVKIVISGLSILFVCIFICLIHVNDIGTVARRDHLTYLTNQFYTAKEVLEEEVKEQNEATKLVAQNFMELPEEDRDEAAQDLIVKYETILPQYRFAYVDKLTYLIIYSDREESALGILEQLSSQRRAEHEVTFAQEKMLKENGEYVSALVSVYPIYEAEKVTAYAMGFRTFSEEFLDVKYEQMLVYGDVSLVNRNGTILGTSIQSEEIKQDSFDFFQWLAENSNQTEKTNRILSGMRGKLSYVKTGDVEYTDAVGREQQILYGHLEGTEDAYLFVTHSPDLIVQSIRPLLFRSLISCMFMILLMIGLISFVWGSHQNSQQLIEELAFRDRITGGKNMNYFQQRAMEIITQNREIPFLLYRFDILNFRYINEVYGHEKADAVLASCIREFESRFDKKELCARVNSDQFVALVINDAEVSNRWKNFYAAVGEAARMEGVRYPIRFKTGVYQVRKGDSDIPVMIDHANVARKSLSGEEKILEATYSDSIISNMKKIDKIETEMQYALNSGEFKMYLQPKWDIMKNEVAGAEALVRWIKPDGSIVLPNEFIPVFEKNGFIEKLDYYMLETLCRMLHELHIHPDLYREYPVSVNQSRILINNPDYVKNVEKIINKYDAPIPYLEIEITETVFFSERNKMVDVMNQLKDMGITLSMDDFGSGYSSLNVLKDIPFDIMKIDREFFSESVTSESSIWIMEKMIEMAHGLGISSICEGVEKAEQVEILKRVGCTMAQGYYYSKPMPMDEYIAKYCDKTKSQNQTSNIGETT